VRCRLEMFGLATAARDNTTVAAARPLAEPPLADQRGARLWGTDRRGNGDAVVNGMAAHADFGDGTDRHAWGTPAR
jgi:hypothetical protein